MTETQLSLEDFILSAPPLEAAEEKPKASVPNPVSKKESAAPAVEAEPVVLSVSDINKMIRGMLEGEFQLIWLRGEISNFKPHSSGHFYFSLKDSKSQISAVMFRGFNTRLRFKPEDGMEVLVRGRITVYEPRGNYQIFCESMEPVGQGALQIAFEKLKLKLAAEGLFDEKRKRKLPDLPQKIALITSPTGAAIRDMVTVLGRRFRGLEILIIPTAVQGATAPEEIVAALAKVNKISGPGPQIDVVILGRGGGSMEDLWAFNDERVARAIVNCRYPIISAVGHEIDFTIADFVADVRAPTPSAAAEIVVQNADELNDEIRMIYRRITQVIHSRTELLKRRFQGAAKRLIDPQRRLQDLMLRNDELAQRLESSLLRNIERERQNVHLLTERLGSPIEKVVSLRVRLDHAKIRLASGSKQKLSALRHQLQKHSSVLDSLSPLRVLDRGYSIVSKKKAVLKTTDDLLVGDIVGIRFAEGTAEAEIKKILKEGDPHGL